MQWFCILFFVQMSYGLHKSNFFPIHYSNIYTFFLKVGWDLRHQVLRPLLAYCTAPDDR
jgi:hypothetical protein